MKIVLKAESIQNHLACLVLTATQLRFAFDSTPYKAISAGLLLAIFLGILYLQTKVSEQTTSTYKTSRLINLFAISVFGSFLLAIINNLGSPAGVYRSIFYLFYISIIVLISHLMLNPKRRSPDHIVNLVYGNLAVYISINLILFMFDLKKEWADQFLNDYDSGKATMLRTLGFEVNRVFFYLSNGVNSFGVACAMLLGLAVSKLIFQSKISSGLLLGTAGILLTDMRSAIPFVVLSLGISLTIVKLGWYRAGKIALPFLPFLAVAPLLLGIAADNDIISADWLVRSSSAEAMTLNGRTIIWGIVFLHFLSFEPQHLIGYGILGQGASGIAQSVEATDIFSNYASPEFISMHNAYIQTLVDSGYIGLILYLCVLAFLYQRIAALGKQRMVNKETATNLFFIFFLIAISGNTETSNQINGQLFVFFVFLWMYFRWLPLPQLKTETMKPAIRAEHAERQ